MDEEVGGFLFTGSKTSLRNEPNRDQEPPSQNHNNLNQYNNHSESQAHMRNEPL